MPTCLRWLLSFSVILFIAAPSVAQAPKPPVKVGVLMPYTGTLAVIGQDTTRGMELALAQVGSKAGGREIQLIKEDTEAKPATGLVKTRKLVENDRVDLLVGPVSSAVALAIEPYVRQQQVPLIIPVAFTRELTAAGRANPFIFRLIETTDQSNFPMGEWVYKNTPSAQLIVAAIESLKGELGDKAQLREALRSAITKIRPPRGPVQFDAYQQVITSVYVMKVERRGNRLANAIVDQIPNVSQEATWKWWQK